MTIQSPIAWGLDQLRLGAQSLGSAPADAYWPQSARQAGVPAIRRIGPADLRDALARGAWSELSPLVPRAVVAYAREKGLYGAPT